MRNVLAITMALMLAAIILSPACAYMIQSMTPESYRIGAERSNYSFHAGTPASNLTPALIPSILAPTSKVTAIRVPYSIKIGSVVPNSSRRLGMNASSSVQSPGARTVGTTIASSKETLGAQMPTPTLPTGTSTTVLPEQTVKVTPPKNVTALTAPTTSPHKLSIMGTVYDDKNGNGIKEADETGLAGWIIKLERPVGTIIAKTTTNDSGDYTFNDLTPGVYAIFEVLHEDWSADLPAAAVNLTDMDAKNVDFANKR